MLNNRTLQGFLALAPLVSLVFIFVGYFVFIFSLISNSSQLENKPDDFPTEILGGIAVIFIFIFLSVIISLLSLIYFIIHAAKNPNLEQNNMRLVWILIIVLVSGIGNLIYWIAEIQTKKTKPIIP